NYSYKLRLFFWTTAPSAQFKPMQGFGWQIDFNLRKKNKKEIFIYEFIHSYFLTRQGLIGCPGKDAAIKASACIFNQ
ncbi:MAG: hypothetical protein PHT91_01760, partial [Candidatus Nanoarchaeia archaeon]|nr:hypothetical protein [Candidatus Nanoarchaeia archaeon]